MMAVFLDILAPGHTLDKAFLEFVVISWGGVMTLAVE